MDPVLLALIVVGVLLIVIVVPLGLALRALVWRRPYREGDWQSWKQAAKTLRWRDRWTIYWANSWGRPVHDPWLAALAIQRGERAYATVTSAANQLRWLFWLVAALQLAAGVALGGTAGILYFMLAGLFVLMPALTQRGGRMAKRSADASRAILTEHDTASDTHSG